MRQARMRKARMRRGPATLIAFLHCSLPLGPHLGLPLEHPSGHPPCRTTRHSGGCVSPQLNPTERRFVDTTLIRARVGGEEDFPQVIDGYQGVDLRRGDRRVTQQLLDDPDVRSTIQQVGRVRMSQGMR